MISFRPLRIGLCGSPSLHGHAWFVNRGDPSYLRQSWEPILQVGEPFITLQTLGNLRGNLMQTLGGTLGKPYLEVQDTVGNWLGL